MVHLPTQAEWKDYLEVIYHDFLLNNDPNVLAANKVTLAHKEKHEKNF